MNNCFAWKFANNKIFITLITISFTSKMPCEMVITALKLFIFCNRSTPKAEDVNLDNRKGALNK